MKSLDILIENLQENTAVDALFMTGSHATGAHTSSSDIDLVIILNNNTANIRSVYQIIDGTFADIFFFEKSTLEELMKVSSTLANSPLEQGILVSWILKSEIVFDKSGTLTKLKEHAPQIVQEIPEYEKIDVLQRISYNLFQNKRYFSSNNPLYHEALSIRLLYSVVECIAAYLTLRDRPWRGEKDAIQYIKESSSDFYKSFSAFNSAATLEEKMDIYENMVEFVPLSGTSLFDYKKSVPLSMNQTNQGELDKLRAFWDELSQKRA